MNKKDLLDRLSIRSQYLTPQDTKQALDLIIQAFASTLANQGRIEIRGFGTFCTRIRPPRIGRNPKTGELIKVDAKPVIRFKAGSGFKQN